MVAQAYPVIPGSEPVGTPVDLVCYEKMPSPKEIMYTAQPFVSKRTYCGSELVYDPEMLDGSVQNLFPCEECEKLPIHEKCPRCSEKIGQVSGVVFSKPESPKVADAGADSKLDLKKETPEITPDLIKAGGLSELTSLVPTEETRDGSIGRAGSPAKPLMIERTVSVARNPSSSRAGSPDNQETFVYDGPKRLRQFSAEPLEKPVRACLNRVGLDDDQEDIPKLEREG